MLRRPPRSTLFPYTTSSDLLDGQRRVRRAPIAVLRRFLVPVVRLSRVSLALAEVLQRLFVTGARDRKSTRLNSSHTVISYAVFCLKKKNTRHFITPPIQ